MRTSAMLHWEVFSLSWGKKKKKRACLSSFFQASYTTRIWPSISEKHNFKECAIKSNLAIIPVNNHSPSAWVLIEPSAYSGQGLSLAVTPKMKSYSTSKHYWYIPVLPWVKSKHSKKQSRTRHLRKKDPQTPDRILLKIVQSPAERFTVHQVCS